MSRIDLNADLGEECGDDSAMLRLVSSASLACGGHAGGGAVLEETVRLAVEARVTVGAHPSYRDREEFGRHSHFDAAEPEALIADLVGQITEVGRVAAGHNHPLAYVKPHGALYHDVAQRPEGASLLIAVLEQVESIATAEQWPSWGPGRLPILGLPGSRLELHAEEADVPFFREAFADRAYLPSGGLVPRSHPDAVLNLEQAVRQAVEIATNHSVMAIDGTRVALQADSICLHGDTPDAVNMAHAVREALETSGFTIASVVGKR